MIKIRRAEPNDLTGITEILQAVWNESIQTDAFHHHLQAPQSALWVAATNLNALGFISSFLSKNVHGQRRWEVDLLAVHPSYQGQGLGTALIQATGQDAAHHRVDLARALVRTDNAASQAAFNRAGYTCNPLPHKLLIWPPQPTDEFTPIPAGITLLPVDTLTYRGLWIEGLFEHTLTPAQQAQTIHIAQARLAQEKRHNTGAQIPAIYVQDLPDAVRQSATVHGEYHCWMKSVE